MNDERLYAQVVEELQGTGPKPGLWAKAFAEANGVDATARALYLRYRVAQLAGAEQEAVAAHAAAQKEQKRLEASVAEAARRLEAEQAEEARKARAKLAGFTGIHWILIFLPILMILCLVFGALIN